MLPTWFTADELTGPVEIALIGLADQYDPSRGVPFRAFAQRRIYGACFDAVRRKEYVERGHLSLDSESVSRSVDLNIKALKARHVEPRSSSASPEDLASDAQYIRIWWWVQRLPPRHALVIFAVYGGGMTLEQLATKVDVGASRLSQIHHEALSMLRADLEKAA
jgi:RNA polymerase sigma factor (sigma-70 family)